jgi:hypothetical protein
MKMKARRARGLLVRRTMTSPPEHPHDHDPTVVLRARQMIALTLASFALSGGAAPAQQRNLEPAQQVEQIFQKADTDKNGKLSKGEAAAIPEIAARFEELDKDRDGALSFAEFVSGFGAPDRR